MKLIKTFFYSLKKSLFDPSYYRDVAHANFSFSFKYLWLFLLAIVFIKTLVFGGLYLKNRPQIAPTVNKFINNAYEFYPRELKLNVINGELSTNVEEPYFIDLGESTGGRPHFIIIDTKGSIDNYPNYNTYVLATKNAVVYPSKSRNSEISQTSVFYFRDMKDNFSVDRNYYDEILNKIKPYAVKATSFIDVLVLVGLSLFLGFGSLFWTLITMASLLVLTLIVWVFAKIIRVNYSYSSFYKIGMHAVTWPILITEIINLFNPLFMNLYLLIFFVAMLIILFSLREAKVATKTVKAKKSKK